MEVVCMYCRRVLGKKDGQDGISHTICSICIPVQHGDLFSTEEIAKMVSKQREEEAKLKKS